MIYVAGEAAASIHRRVIAWMIHHGLWGKGDPTFGVIGCAPNLLNGDGDIQPMIDSCNRFADRCEVPLDLILFDTLHACAPGSGEDSEDTSRIIDNVRHIQQATTGPAAGWLHHSGKDSSRGPRGSSSLSAAVDVSIEVVEEANCRRPIARKVRDGKLPDFEPFDIEGMPICTDDGEPVTAGYLVSAKLALNPTDANASRQDQARSMHKAGQSIRTIAVALGVPKSTISDWIKHT